MYVESGWELQLTHDCTELRGTMPVESDHRSKSSTLQDVPAVGCSHLGEGRAGFRKHQGQA